MSKAKIFHKVYQKRTYLNEAYPKLSYKEILTLVWRGLKNQTLAISVPESGDGFEIRCSEQSGYVFAICGSGRYIVTDRAVSYEEFKKSPEFGDLKKLAKK